MNQNQARIAAAASNLLGNKQSEANHRDLVPLAHALVNANGNVMIDASSIDNITQAAFLAAFTRNGVQALTDGATIAYSVTTKRNATVTLAGNRTLSAITNAVAGDRGSLVITQDGTGTRTLAYAAGWNFPFGAPELSTAAAAKDTLDWWTPDGAAFYAVLRPVSATNRNGVQALTDAATIAYNCALGLSGTVTIADNRILGLPSNALANDRGTVRVTQDGTGSRLLTYASGWKFPGGAPSASTAAGAIDDINWWTKDGLTFDGQMSKAYA